MNHSFKFIVNPINTHRIEITSFLQYCALKNILSKLTSNNIKPLKDNRNPVSFSYKITNIKPDVSFTEYTEMFKSEKDAFKTKFLKEVDVSLFFDAISKSIYSGFSKPINFLDLSDCDDPDYPIVNDLYEIFTSRMDAKDYLSTYIPKNSEEVCYINMFIHNDEKSIGIYYDDRFIKFNIIGFENEDSEYQKEYSRIVNCIYKNIDVQKLKNNGCIENTCNEFCVYTEDPTIIHKVLMNNQEIINKMADDIIYLIFRSKQSCLDNLDIFIELQTSIANVENARKSTRKKVEDNLTVLNGLFN